MQKPALERGSASREAAFALLLRLLLLRPPPRSTMPIGAPDLGSPKADSPKAAKPKAGASAIKLNPRADWHAPPGHDSYVCTQQGDSQGGEGWVRGAGEDWRDGKSQITSRPNPAAIRLLTMARPHAWPHTRADPSLARRACV